MIISLFLELKVSELKEQVIKAQRSEGGVNYMTKSKTHNLKISRAASVIILLLCGGTYVLKKWTSMLRYPLPSGLNFGNRWRFRQVLARQIRYLRAYDKWDQAALKSYIRQSCADCANLSSMPAIFTHLADIFMQTQQVGSSVYTQMYKASKFKSKRKLRLVLRQLGAVIDDEGFLQLYGSHTFAPKLAPHAEFYTLFRTDVRRAYHRSSGLSQDSLGRRLHLFRSWIDRQNICYVRQNFAGANDYQKLQNYSKRSGCSLDYTTSSTFHNRQKGELLYPHNMEVQVPAANTKKVRETNNARMAEFIVDLNTGNFVSEWNVYKLRGGGVVDSSPNRYSLGQKEQIANTESFNYGIPRGQRHDLSRKDQSHYRLDVVHPADPLVRRQSTKLFKAPTTLAHGGGYVDLIKRSADYTAWQAVLTYKRAEHYQKYCELCKKEGQVKGYGAFASEIRETLAANDEK